MVNNTLPKLTCHTCRNKFHSGVLPAPEAAGFPPTTTTLSHTPPYRFMSPNPSGLAHVRPFLRHRHPACPRPAALIACLRTETVLQRPNSVPVQVVQHFEQERVPDVPIAVVFVTAFTRIGNCERPGGVRKEERGR